MPPHNLLIWWFRRNSNLEIVRSYRTLAAEEREKRRTQTNTSHSSCCPSTAISRLVISFPLNTLRVELANKQSYSCTISDRQTERQTELCQYKGYTVCGTLSYHLSRFCTNQMKIQSILKLDCSSNPYLIFKTLKIITYMKRWKLSTEYSLYIRLMGQFDATNSLCLVILTVSIKA